MLLIRLLIHSCQRLCWASWLPALGLGLLVSWNPAQAHEVPNDVRIQAFFKPKGERLQLLVRVPLAAMQEVDFPRREGGYLDLPKADAALHTATRQWLADNLSVFENEQRLPYPRVVQARVSLPSDRSFTEYDRATAHLQGERLPVTLDLYWNQALLDVWLEFPIHSERSAFSIDPRWARLGLRVVTSLLVLPPEGSARAFEFHGNPGLLLLDPRWHQAALRFVKSGFIHILEGTDHLLFILCLVLPIRRLKPLIVVITAFTLAHSVTLMVSAFGWAPDGLWFAPLVEALIAASIVFMALDNIVTTAARGEVDSLRRWGVTCAFGLVHGFAYSFGLRESLQFAGSHQVTALLAFNVGVELGQLLVLALLWPVLQLLCKAEARRTWSIMVASALVAHTGWHWMIERGERLAQFPWPAWDDQSWVLLLRVLWVLVVAVACVWGWCTLVTRRRNSRLSDP